MGFCIMNSLAHDEGAKIKKYPLFGSNFITADSEDNLSGYCEDILFGSLKNLTFEYSTLNTAITSFACNIQRNCNLRSQKLNLLTIDIPPPYLIHFL